MICELEGVNNRNDVEDLVVLSTDIEAMYPSLDTDQVAADVAREFLDCELEVNYDGEGRAGIPTTFSHSWLWGYPGIIRGYKISK